MYNGPMENKEKRILMMDGSEHTVPGRRTRDDEGCDCAVHGKNCPKCGGFMHFQPIYGGQYWECEDCGEDA